MNDSEKWATAVMVADRMLNAGLSSDISIDPKDLTLQRTRNVILSGEPIEFFSQEMPIFVPESPDEDSLRPIDVLYGRYIQQTRTIEIFVKRIHQDAHLFSCEPTDLTCIVRIHEYAHAILHSGVSWRDARKNLSDYTTDGRTDWDSFKRKRDASYLSINMHCHELIAQAITYSSVCQIPDRDVAARLTEVFSSLEGKQPPHYRLSADIKQACQCVNWPLVLDAARGAVVKLTGNTFGLDEGILALIRKTAEHL